MVIDYCHTALAIVVLLGRNGEHYIDYNLYCMLYLYAEESNPFRNIN